MLSGQADVTFNFTVVCTFFYAVNACLNRNHILTDFLIKNFFEVVHL